MIRKKFINTFNDSITSFKENIAYFKNEKRKSKNRSKKCKLLSSILKTIDNSVIIALISSFAALSVPGLGWNFISFSNETARDLSLKIKVMFENFLKEYKKLKNKIERAGQNFNSFENIYRKWLQDEVIVKKE